MKLLTITRALLALMALAWIGIAPQKAQAQITVFDPATYASVGKIWAQDASTYTKILEEVQQVTKIASQDLLIYNLAMQETRFLDKGQFLQAMGFFAQHAQIPGHTDWDNTMMTAGGLAKAGLTWQAMTNPRMSLQSRIAMANSFATSSLNSLGSCNSAAISNDSALGGLQKAAVSMDPANNTAASLGALNNMNQIQTVKYMQCQENLAEQRLKLQMIQAHESMDRDQYTYTTNTTVDQYNANGGGMYNVSIEQDIRITGMH